MWRGAPSKPGRHRDGPARSGWIARWPPLPQAAVGARRLVAQSFAAWRFARVGGLVLTEEDPPDLDPPVLNEGDAGIVQTQFNWRYCNPP